MSAKHNHKESSDGQGLNSVLMAGIPVTSSKHFVFRRFVDGVSICTHVDEYMADDTNYIHIQMQMNSDPFIFANVVATNDNIYGDLDSLKLDDKAAATHSMILEGSLAAQRQYNELLQGELDYRFQMTDYFQDRKNSIEDSLDYYSTTEVLMLQMVRNLLISTPKAWLHGTTLSRLNRTAIDSLDKIYDGFNSLAKISDTIAGYTARNIETLSAMADNSTNGIAKNFLSKNLEILEIQEDVASIYNRMALETKKQKEAMQTMFSYGFGVI